MLENLRPAYERTLRPAVSALARIGVRPNHVTVAGVAVFAVAGFLAATGHWYWSAACVTLGALLDGCDGQLARVTGYTSDFGAVLDSCCDRLTEICWIAGIFWYYLRAPGDEALASALCVAALSGSLMVSYVKARCEGQGVACREGLMQRPERIILLGVAQLCGPAVMVYGMGLLAVLSWVTVFERLAIARSAVKSATHPVSRA
jgi:phosphatidylglycerophosphate synthase